jgi:L-iditol 2-dehydrogenase
LKSSFIYGPRDIRISEVPDAEPGPGEVLLEVRAVGVCGSDLHTYTLGNVGGVVAAQPLILGHEAAGVIVALGPGVDQERHHVGQAVAIDPAMPCGECERCKAGQPNLCLRLKFLGMWPDHGALRQRMVHPARSCVPMPDGLSPVSAALLEPLGVALHAVRLAQIQMGEDVIVIGCGAIGLLIIRLARLAGARHIFAVDRYAWRLDDAANFGADVVLNTDQVSVVEEVMRRTNKRGVDVAFEAAWVKDTAEQCVEVARLGGRVILVGIPAEDELTVRASLARRKELSILYSRRMRHTYPTTVALVMNQSVDLDKLASHRFTLDQTQDAFETASRYVDGVVRAMVLPNG